jgi:predicted AAA+ superfamily ATPase
MWALGRKGIALVAAATEAGRNARVARQFGQPCMGHRGDRPYRLHPSLSTD